MRRLITRDHSHEEKFNVGWKRTIAKAPIMDGESKPLDPPGTFLKALGESLKAKEGVDADLAAIVATHILTGATASNAVTQAKDAIVKLAIERANPPKVEVING